MIEKDDQRKLQGLIKRRHPYYAEMLPHWKFCWLTYSGGKSWFKENIFRYIKEGDKDFKKRVERAYRFNHTREVVDLLNKYLFKGNILRSEAAPQFVKDFWERSTLNNLGIADFMRGVSKKNSIFGRTYIVVDSSRTVDGVVSIAEAKKIDGRVYAYTVNPENVLDMSFDEHGELNWILLHEEMRDDKDPFTDKAERYSQYRLWTRTQWGEFKVKKGSGTQQVEFEGMQDHNLGMVPVVIAEHVLGDDEYASTGLIDDVVYLDKAAANYLSNIDQIIQDQTFSQLAMPAQGVLPGEEAYDKLVDMGTKRIFLYDGESTTAPFYLSPDVKQAELILKIVNKVINEIYHTVGLAGERTKDDNGAGIDNSSGVAKAYDFERVNSLLASKADSLEVVENRVLKIVAAWEGQDLPEEKLVHYPDDFDVRGLKDEFDIAARLALIEAPATLRREQMLQLIDKLFPMLKKDLKEKIKTELKSWGEAPDPAQEAKESGMSMGDRVKKESANSISNQLVS